MKTSSTVSTAENMALSITEKQKGIENHRKIADYLLAAAANHFKAAGHLKAGEYEKAAQCAMSAKEYLDLAAEAKRYDINTIHNLHI